ncbi:hypothetical protein L873DRAFT_1312534 [Choiromyces venosus 120613-1]|uniref:Uncharacterized protein n=1 Tax=Choiromyces venosus 120613-1 TaxID=1336337 RepID=A0A3N4JFI3_9PEZI|nr:hypothetical protein L873DRAFT_1312534 [Choiromyces venosus 120613-1]
MALYSVLGLTKFLVPCAGLAKSPIAHPFPKIGISALRACSTSFPDSSISYYSRGTSCLGLFNYSILNTGRSKLLGSVIIVRIRNTCATMQPCAFDTWPKNSRDGRRGLWWFVGLVMRELLLGVRYWSIRIRGDSQVVSKMGWERR